MRGRSAFIGRLAAITQITFAMIIGVVASFQFEAGFVPRGAALLVVFALPGLVGLIGVGARRPALLVAAGLVSTFGAFIAFSGVTLIFLIPALLFFAGAARLAGAPVAGAARERAASGLVQVVLAAAIVVLLLGAGASTLLVTDSGCWTMFRSGSGVRIETGPFTSGEVSVPLDAVSTACSTGLLSARGTGLGAVLGGAALALALVAARRRQPWSGPPEA